MSRSRKNNAEVRLHFPLCDQLKAEYLGYVGTEHDDVHGDVLVFDHPKGGKVLIRRDDFMKRHEGHIPYDYIP